MGAPSTPPPSQAMLSVPPGPSTEVPQPLSPMPAVVVSQASMGLAVELVVAMSQASVADRLPDTSHAHVRCSRKRIHKHGHSRSRSGSSSQGFTQRSRRRVAAYCCHRSRHHFRLSGKSGRCYRSWSSRLQSLSSPDGFSTYSSSPDGRSRPSSKRQEPELTRTPSSHGVSPSRAVPDAVSEDHLVEVPLSSW